MTTATHPHSSSDTEGHWPPRILVVEHEANAGAGLVGRRVTHAGMETVTVGPETENTTIPTEASAYDGVIVLGGTPGPAEDDVAPWLPDVRALITWCLDSEKPYFGVCLGGQMLAYVAGGSVGDVRWNGTGGEPIVWARRRTAPPCRRARCASRAGRQDAFGKRCDAAHGEAHGQALSASARQTRWRNPAASATPSG